MIPKKIKAGDEIRIIAPSRSLGIISQEIRKIAEEKLAGMGFRISYAKNSEEIDLFRSSSIESRVADLHEAFSDKNVKGILTVIGGFNVNQILKYLDYDLIKNNPKIICGFSDITALSNAIYAKTGLITYSGPHFSTFGMIKGIGYTSAYFEKCLMQESPFEIIPSDEWSDDAWYLNQENREFIKNEGFQVINAGEAAGVIIGGNLGTLNLLQGTEFMPSLRDAILFLEDDDMNGKMFPVSFDRDLQSLIHQPDFKNVRGIIIGRFQKGADMTKDKLINIIKSKKELSGIPIIAGVDFGHTTPQITFPIGGTVKLTAKDEGIKLEIIEH
ncbi:MAG: LD-carboxypeptidase [Candidatus Moranbacteria bacterium]|nr:LD-carboxypeptidase [Candidatus Moranbacteria bacterium]